MAVIGLLWRLSTRAYQEALRELIEGAAWQVVALEKSTAERRCFMQFYDAAESWRTWRSRAYI